MPMNILKRILCVQPNSWNGVHVLEGHATSLLYISYVEPDEMTTCTLGNSYE